MSWTDFKNKHLFSLNLALVASFILWQFRGDFLFHPVIGCWFLATLFSLRLREKEKKGMLFIGKMNGMLILSIFYFLIFSPFSIFYRMFFRHQSFKKRSSTFEAKENFSPFNRPF